MAFSGEVNDGARFVFVEQTRYQIGIANVTTYERMPCVTLQAGKVLQITGVGEFVEIDNGIVAPT